MKGTQSTSDTVFKDTARPESVYAVRTKYPVTNFMNPTEVVDDLQLTRAERGEVLASRTSGSRALPNAPTSRQLDSGAVVHADDVLRALKSLEAGQDEKLALSDGPRRFEDWLLRFRTQFKAIMRRSWSDDDDDPPPCPVMAAGPLAGPLFGGESVDPILTVAA